MNAALLGVAGLRGVRGVIVGVLIQRKPVLSVSNPGVIGEGRAFLSGLRSGLKRSPLNSNWGLSELRTPGEIGELIGIRPGILFRFCPLLGDGMAGGSLVDMTPLFIWIAAGTMIGDKD